MGIDVEKGFNDLYNYQRQNISRYYELKHYIMFVEAVVFIVLWIAIFEFINTLDIKIKIEEHLKECHSETVVEKGK